MTPVSTTLASGFALPFVVEVPKEPGFLKCQGAELTIEVGRAGRRDAEGIAAVLTLIASLAGTGALGGPDARPGSSTLEIENFEVLSENRFRARIVNAMLDDRAMVVLAHLLLIASRKLDIRSVRLAVPLSQGHVRIGRSRSDDSTYPQMCAPMPFQLENEDPQSDAVTFDIGFCERPTAATAALLNQRFDVWFEAVRKGAYALALLGPEASHVESYDDGFTLIGHHAERSYHKLNADEGAIDAAVNILVAIHQQGHAIDTLRIA